MSRVGVLELGGSHVSSAVVDTTTWQVVPGTPGRRQIDSTAAAMDLLDSLVGSAQALAGSEVTAWGVALPGPFDYKRGTAWFSGVAKFEGLYGVDIGEALRIGIPTNRPVTFVNDATAFLLGEATAGSMVGRTRAVGVTLGTGIGSAFLAGGRIVTDGAGVPPAGEIYRLRHCGVQLEEVVSHRAILKAHADKTSSGGAETQVRQVAIRARQGEAAAADAISGAFVALGVTIAPWLRRFDAQSVVFGGSMTGAWDLIEPALRSGLSDGGAPDVQLVVSPDAEHSALVGAAKAASPR